MLGCSERWLRGGEYDREAWEVDAPIEELMRLAGVEAAWLKGLRNQERTSDEGEHSRIVGQQRDR